MNCLPVKIEHVRKNFPAARKNFNLPTDEMLFDGNQAHVGQVALKKNLARVEVADDHLKISCRHVKPQAAVKIQMQAVNARPP